MTALVRQDGAIRKYNTPEAIDIAWSRPAGRLTHGAICAGLSAALVWTVTTAQALPSLFSSTDQAIVWILLLSWMGYWMLKELRLLD